MSLHTYLEEKNGAYASWHQSPIAAPLHWVAFLLIAAFLTSTIGSEVQNFGTSAADLTAAVASADFGRYTKKPIPEPANDHILVKFKNSLSKSKIDQIIAAYGLRQERIVPNLNIRVLKLSAGDTPEEIVNRLRVEEGNSIDFAEVDMVRR